MSEKRDKIIIYNTDLENNVTENLTLEDGELALVREKDKERLYIKNTAGVVVPIHNILDGGEIELPTIQSEWIDAGLASWSGDTSLKNQVRFDSRHISLQGAFIPPAVSDIDTLTDMGDMFAYCSGLTSLDVSSWDTSNVTDMSYMFGYCSGLTSLDVSSWDTSKVTDMSWMFYGCSGLTSLNVSNFKTSKVTDMNTMFEGCSGLKSLNVSGWNIRHMTSMSQMFNNCSGLTSLDLSSFNISNITTIGDMFEGCTSLKEIKCTKATKDKILSFSDNGLSTNFNGWIIVEPPVPTP